ncbi:hypothetical protein NADFUDRAFT_12632, partial [Nadsonia fulvescens var. elongata DSM 6958]
RSRLAELAAKRNGNKGRNSDLVYDEVDENEYRNIVRSRLEEDDFVEDDNGEGYAETGADDWDTRHSYYSDEEESPMKSKSRGNAHGRKRNQTAAKDDGNIGKFLQSKKVISLKPKPVMPMNSKQDDEDFMDDLINNIADDIDIPFSSPSNKANSKKARLNHTPVTKRPRIIEPSVSLKKSLPKFSDNDMMNLDLGHEDLDVDIEMDIPSALPPSSPSVKAFERQRQVPHLETLIKEGLSNHEYPSDDEDEILVPQRPTARALTANQTSKVNFGLNGEHNAVPMSSPQKSDNAVNRNSNEAGVKFSMEPMMPLSGAQVEPKEVVSPSTNKLQFYWLDYTEVKDILVLFGKVQLVDQPERYVSCCLQVRGIHRDVYFLPRDHRMRNGLLTHETVDLADVHDEVSGILNQRNLKEFRSKPCTRKYCFEIPGVPKETEYLKVLYPYNRESLPADLEGETFSRVFGASTSLFEQFVLNRRIMGPCWLEIASPEFDSVKNTSWCKIDVLANSPLNVVPLPDSADLPPPTLNIMSLSIRTTMNDAANAQELIALSYKIFENTPMDETTPAERLSHRSKTIVRPPNQIFPMGFEQEINKLGDKSIMVRKTEKEMITIFLSHVQNYDPDVIVGHQLENIHLNILLARMKTNKTKNWSKIGRLRRTDWPQSFGKGANNVFAERQCLSGRLLCDISNDLGKSLMSKCQSWSLSEMCSLILGGIERREFDIVINKNSRVDTARGLYDFINHNNVDALYIMAIAFKVQILPLSKQLTNLAGNSWARTLSGTRAERNEYILLHEFVKQKYIVPDKAGYNNTTNKSEESVQTSTRAAPAAHKKKDTFKGGLVFEPEKGLYDHIILVMDFNSLYPSIIQEFNICFTTVNRSECAEYDEKPPEVPDSALELGILPRLIQTLVQRRREVKRLLKDPKASEVQRTQWDIKQQALKLTANSMYGCLGYEKSRFYARPLAMLTTLKGREILMNTKELAESKSLKVVYGDTDSVMINTNVDSYEEAMKIGNEFKRAVNESYKLLEIDIDNLFRRLLLYAKKKYAALNMSVLPNGEIKTMMEIKGLDMRRREYCGLSKKASQKILDEILSGKPSEDAIATIHEYLRTLSAEMRNDEIKLNQYIIHTQLSKRPEDYPGAKSMPQVQVALRKIRKGGRVNAGDVIAYITTAPPMDENNKPIIPILPAPERAYSVSEVIESKGELKPDVDWYLEKQIFPPIERLCGTIPGTDASRLAECLGMDTRRYINQYSSHHNQGEGNSGEIFQLESTIDDSSRYKDAKPLILTCGNTACKATFGFMGIAHATVKEINGDGLLCPQCSHRISMTRVNCQLESLIRFEIARYYTGWLTCDDSSCGLRTRQINVYGKRCLGSRGLARGCRGIMRYEYSDKMLYRQLCYFESLFDIGKAKKLAERRTSSGEAEAEIKIRNSDLVQPDQVNLFAELNRTRFDKTKREVIDKYLKNCGRRYVDMHSIFSF